MKVFRIKFNSLHFHGFYPVDSGVWTGDLFRMDGRPKLKGWVAPAVFIFNAELKRGHFFHLCDGAMVVDGMEVEKLKTTWERAGELLPLKHGEDHYYLLNVLECLDCLDKDKSVWRVDSSGGKIGVEKYVFNPAKFSDSSIFKIPETARGEILTITGLKGKGEEFKTVVEREGLEGVHFEEIWEG